MMRISVVWQTGIDNLVDYRPGSDILNINSVRCADALSEVIFSSVLTGTLAKTLRLLSRLFCPRSPVVLMGNRAQLVETKGFRPDRWTLTW